ncbi:MAG: oligoribonuclease [Candidatus Aureabacteria bacterium]|nr:oligoribonuclease [Candidatus Auribacterota bacterium]
MNHTSLLVWMDLEMSGLDPEHSVILEIASVITDNHLQLVAEGPNLVIHQTNTILETMDDWNKIHHEASGLIKRVKTSTTTLEEAEETTLKFIQLHCKEREAPLCGNTIGQDRRFLRKYMPKVENWLHYRNIDVSTLKELIARWYPEHFDPPKKGGTHKAVADIHESIRELLYYKNTFLKDRTPLRENVSALLDL